MTSSLTRPYATRTINTVAGMLLATIATVAAAQQAFPPASSGGTSVIYRCAKDIFGNMKCSKYSSSAAASSGSVTVTFAGTPSDAELAASLARLQPADPTAAHGKSAGCSVIYRVRNSKGEVEATYVECR